MILARHDESAIRRKFRQRVHKFIQVASAYEELNYQHSSLWIGNEEKFVMKGHGYVWIDESTRSKDLAANMARIEGWRGTRSYNNYVKDLVALCQSAPVLCMDLQYHIDRLRFLRLSNNEATRIYQALERYIVDYDSICQVYDRGSTADASCLVYYHNHKVASWSLPTDSFILMRRPETLYFIF